MWYTVSWWQTLHGMISLGRLVRLWKEVKWQVANCWEITVIPSQLMTVAWHYNAWKNWLDCKRTEFCSIFNTCSLWTDECNITWGVESRWKHATYYLESRFLHLWPGVQYVDNFSIKPIHCVNYLCRGKQFYKYYTPVFSFSILCQICSRRI